MGHPTQAAHGAPSAARGGSRRPRTACGEGLRNEDQAAAVGRRAMVPATTELSDAARSASWTLSAGPVYGFARIAGRFQPDSVDAFAGMRTHRAVGKSRKEV